MKEKIERFEKLLLEYKSNANYIQYDSFKVVVSSLFISCNLARMKFYNVQKR